MNNIFKQLIDLVEAKKPLELELTQLKEEFKNSIVSKEETLKQLNDQEDQLRKEIVAVLEKNNETSIMIDDKTISRQVKKTLKINDPALLLSSMVYNAETLNVLGIDVNVVKNEVFKSEMVIIDKKQAMEIIEKFENVEAKLLGGVEEVKTSFITVRNN